MSDARELLDALDDVRTVDRRAGRLVKALDAVLELHTPHWNVDLRQNECWDGDEWPCDTVQAIASALAGESDA